MSDQAREVAAQIFENMGHAFLPTTATSDPMHDLNCLRCFLERRAIAALELVAQACYEKAAQLKRYGPANNDGGGMVVDKHGEYVQLDDVLALAGSPAPAMERHDERKHILKSYLDCDCAACKQFSDWLDAYDKERLVVVERRGAEIRGLIAKWRESSGIANSHLRRQCADELEAVLSKEAGRC